MKLKYFLIPALMLMFFSINTFSQENKSNSDNQYLTKADVMPIPVGGIAAIQKHVHYPEIAKRAGIQGKVLVKAFVNEKGIVTDAGIIKGIGSGCDVTALSAVKTTKFIPGKKDGKAVKVQITVPILFKLAEKKESK